MAIATPGLITLQAQLEPSLPLDEVKTGTLPQSRHLKYLKLIMDATIQERAATISLLMSLTISDELLKAVKMSEQELLQEIVLILFQQEKLTLGRASRLLNMPQITFQRLLASRKISVHYGVEDFRQDVESLQANGWR